MQPKSNCEQLQSGKRFAPIPLFKRATGAIRSFSRVNCSFTHKKRAVRSKNQRANSQPRIKVTKNNFMLCDKNNCSAIFYILTLKENYFLQIVQNIVFYLNFERKLLSTKYTKI